MLRPKVIGWRQQQESTNNRPRKVGTHPIAMTSSCLDPTHVAGAPVTARTRVPCDENVACGESLRRARQRRGLTLEQIARSTKIPLRHLDALEHDELAALPGGMYRRAYVKAYADAVGLDPRVALAWLNRALEESMPRTAAGIHAAAPSAVSVIARPRVSTIGGAAVATAVMALAMWARQPGAGLDIAPSAVPASPAASSVVPTPHAPNHGLTASSGGTGEPPSAPPKRRTEPASVLPASNAQPQTGPADGSTAAASTADPRLTVITQPVGARVTVNGVGWGSTPLTIRYLDPGPKRVRVLKEGYRAEERLVEFKADGSTTTLRIRMRNAD